MAIRESKVAARLRSEDIFLLAMIVSEMRERDPAGVPAIDFELLWRMQLQQAKPAEEDMSLRPSAEKAGASSVEVQR